MSLGVVALLVIVLIVLALLQYRWSGQISDAERERLRSSLNTSVALFREEFQRELIRPASPTYGEPRGPNSFDWQQLPERFDSMLQGLSHPDLIAQVYFWEAEGPLRQMNRAAGKWDEIPPPGPLTAWRERAAVAAGEGPSRPQFGWSLETSIPALVRPVMRFGERRERGGEPGGPPLVIGWMIVALNQDYLQREILPDLAQRYFSGPEGWTYQVAVIDTRTKKPLYRSSNHALEAPDATANLAESVSPGGPPPPPGEGGPRRRRGRFGGGGRGGPMMLQAGMDGGMWQLVVEHPAGSVERAVNSLRWRNLAVSFGVLLLLAASMAIILISAQRAQRLAAMQMEFVAGVSHELRTPLAVICSAADNLADGVVAAKPQVEQYGDLIRSEGRRLADMVEQILHFASGQAGGARYDIRPLAVKEVVEAAIASVQPLLETSGGSLDTAFSADLPPLLGDASAVGQCLNNLLTNAVKYGGEPPWVRVRTRTTSDGRHVIIEVEDHGLGIDAEDLPHIFDPFYRGAAVMAAQIHGTGLGLSLAKSMAEAMKGKLTVESTPGRGSTFTLQLPAAPAAAHPLTEPAPNLS